MLEKQQRERGTPRGNRQSERQLAIVTCLFTAQLLEISKNDDA